MSGKTGTATLEQAPELAKSIPDQIREIMGRKPPKGLFKFDTRAAEAKKLYQKMLTLLAPYCKEPPEKPKTALELGWSSAELDIFTNVTGQIKALGSSKSYAEAADKINSALDVARTNDRAKQMRADAQAMVLECLKKIKPIAEYNKTKPNQETAELLNGFATRMANIREALKNFTGQPAQILYDANMLADELDEAVKDLPTGPTEQERAGTTPPVLSEAVEKIRAELINQLDAAMKSELAPCRRVVVDATKGSGLAKPEAAADNAVFGLYAARFQKIANLSDRAELPTWDTATDEQRIQNIRARAQTAQQGLQADCKTFRDDFAKNKDQFLVGAKRQETEASGQNLQAARETFEANYKKIESALAQLADMGCAELKTLTADCEDLKTQVINASAYAGSDKLIELKLQKLEMAKSRTASQAKGEADKQTVELKKLQKELAQTYGRLDASVQTAYHVLLDDAKQLSAVLQTGNVAAFKAVEVQIAKIRAAGLGAGADAVVKLVTDARDIRTTATNKDIVKDYSSEANEMLLAVKTTFDNLDIYEVAKAQKELDTVGAEAKKLKDTWLQLGEWRDDVKKRLVAVTDNRKKLQAFVKKSRDKQDTTYDQDFRTVRDGYDKPGVNTADMDKLLIGLETSLPPLLQNLAKETGTDYDRAVQSVIKEQGAAKARTDKEKDEEAAAKKTQEDVKKRRDAYNKLWSETETLVNKAPNGDKDELKELKTLGEQVKDKIKTKDYEGAAKQLDSIEKRLKDLHDYPGGVTSASMARLGQIGDNWQAALGDTNGSLDQVTMAATKVATDLGLVPGEVIKRTQALKQKIAAYNFRDSVLVLSNETAPIGTRKKAREDALKLVRSLQNLLDSDPELLKFEVNPFGVKKPFATMRKFLSELEYNAMRSVPPE